MANVEKLKIFVLYAIQKQIEPKVLAMWNFIIKIQFSELVQ